MSGDNNGPEDVERPPEASEASNESPTRKPARPFYRRPLPLVAIGLAIVCIGAAYAYYLHARQYVSTDNAFVHGNIIQIASQVAGRVAAVPVTDNQHVDKGDLLVRIDPSDYQVALADAKTRRDKAQAARERRAAQLKVANAQVAQSQAEVKVARSKNDNARADYRRYQRLGKDAVSAQKLDSARARYRTTRAQLAAAKQRVQAARARADSARTDIVGAKADVRQARVSIRKARLQLSYTRITAPASGQLASVGVEAGEYVQPGQQLTAEISGQVWVKANFKETSITAMRVGQPVEIEIDAYPERTFAGRVAAIQHATGAEFAVLPPQNATGNFVKIVQRMPVKITFDEYPAVATIGPGLSVVPAVKVRPWTWWPWWPSDGGDIVAGADDPAPKARGASGTAAVRVRAKDRAAPRAGASAPRAESRMRLSPSARLLQTGAPAP